MTTKDGRSFAMSRLSQAPDISALRRVWASLGVTYQRDPQVCSLKDKLKREMEAKKCQ